MEKKTLTTKINNSIVKYYRKEWDVFELAEHLAQQVKELKKNQCKPHMRCLFKAQDYINKNY